jgi:hypothetical protein
MESKELFIHIGFPKTATTTFQKYVFPKHSQIDYLRKEGRNVSFINELFYARENSFSKHAISYSRELHALASNSAHKKLVYSEESLTSFSMFFRFSPHPYIFTTEPNSIARKLKMCFPEANNGLTPKIIISIRRQDELIKSMYAQVYNLVFKRFSSTKTFQKFLQYSFDDNKSGFIADSLLYNELIGQYEALFGQKNVFVSVFEELQEDSDSYIKKLCSFMDIDTSEALQILGKKHVNKKSGESGYRSDKRSVAELLSFYKNKYWSHKTFGFANNNLFDRLKNVYVPGKSLSQLEINSDYRTKLRDLYSKGNEALSKRHNLDLQRFGYYFD